jgi:phage FluMu protein Com
MAEPAVIKFLCGKCIKKIGMDPRFAGRMIKCPRCGEVNRVPDATQLPEELVLSSEVLEELRPVPLPAYVWQQTPPRA